MSKILCTFSGKYGDILWSLPTARALSFLHGCKVDFATMPQYKSLIPLLEKQFYIEKAMVFDDWILHHSNYGDQPWLPPSHQKCGGTTNCQSGWERCYHLGYRAHPGLPFGQPNMAVMDYIAWQQGVKLKDPLPFIGGLCDRVVVSKVYAGFDRELRATVVDDFVTYAFNEQYKEMKDKFLEALREKLGIRVRLVDVTRYAWLEAAEYIQGSLAFVGCRSANWVIANGLNKWILCYEPHPARTQMGHLGEVFGCPYNPAVQNYPLGIPPEVCGEMAGNSILDWVSKNESSKQEAVQ